VLGSLFCLVYREAKSSGNGQRRWAPDYNYQKIRRGRYFDSTIARNTSYQGARNVILAIIRGLEGKKWTSTKETRERFPSNSWKTLEIFFISVA